MKCSILDCPKKSISRGWCDKHYTMWQRHGDPLYKRVLKKHIKCVIDGCERKQNSKGYCTTHAAKLRRTGTLEKINHTPEWGKRNAEARLTELSRLDSTPDKDGRRGYLATNTVSEIKGKARKRGLDWTLEAVIAYKLIIDDCTYCGRASGWPNSRNGIDRVDNHKGYHEDNCVTCCTVCNTGKGDMTLEEFMSWICAVYSRITPKV